MKFDIVCVPGERAVTEGETRKVTEFLDSIEPEFDLASKRKTELVRTLSRYICNSSAQGPTLVDHMVNNLTVHGGRYDPDVAAALCGVASWTYSDPDTLCRLSAQAGFPGGNIVSISLTNEALLMDANVLLLQSGDGRLGIVSFRGTPPTNLITWLGNLSVRVDSFGPSGRVHGSFYRTTLSLFETLSKFIDSMTDSENICDAALKIKAETVFPKEVQGGATGELLKDKLLKNKLQALYVTGHSLGGALAVLTTTLLLTDPGDHFSEKNKKLDQLVGGVYTFGQPLVGDRGFAAHGKEMFGKKYFRHIYNHDFMPHLPPRSAGVFQHFGAEYRSTDSGWTETDPERFPQSPTLLFNLPWVALDWVVDQIPVLTDAVDWLQRIPAVGRYVLPYSVADHSPLNYLRTSLITHPGSEIAMSATP
jgi:hypothetical protein